jgi:hypothetical protein
MSSPFYKCCCRHEHPDWTHFAEGCVDGVFAFILALVGLFMVGWWIIGKIRTCRKKNLQMFPLFQTFLFIPIACTFLFALGFVVSFFFVPTILSHLILFPAFSVADTILWQYVPIRVLMLRSLSQRRLCKRCGVLWRFVFESWWSEVIVSFFIIKCFNSTIGATLMTIGVALHAVARFVLLVFFIWVSFGPDLCVRWLPKLRRTGLKSKFAHCTCIAATFLFGFSLLLSVCWSKLKPDYGDIEWMASDASFAEAQEAYYNISSCRAYGVGFPVFYAVYLPIMPLLLHRTLVFETAYWRGEWTSDWAVSCTQLQLPPRQRGKHFIADKGSELLHGTLDQCARDQQLIECTALDISSVLVGKGRPRIMHCARISPAVY